MATDRHRRDRSPAPTARFRPLTPDQAEGKAGEPLGHLVGRHGQVGATVATMVHSSAVAGSLDLSRAMKRAQLARTLSERLFISVQVSLGCQACLDIDIEAARRIGVGAEDDLRPRPHRELNRCGATAVKKQPLGCAGKAEAGSPSWEGETVPRSGFGEKGDPR